MPLMTTPVRRGSVPIHATGTVHFLRWPRPLQGGMAKRKKAADEAAVECVLRVVSKDGRTLIEIEIPDDAAALAIAAKLLKGARK